MTRKPDPRLNASLIREGRMIFQQLSQIFGNSRPSNFNDVMIAEAQAKAAKAPKSEPLYCVFCLHVRKTNPRTAYTVMNGQAVCEDHSYYTQGGDFNRIVAIIRGDEQRNPQK